MSLMWTWEGISRPRCQFWGCFAAFFSFCELGHTLWAHGNHARQNIVEYRLQRAKNKNKPQDCQSLILCIVKISAKKRGEIKASWDTEKLRNLSPRDTLFKKSSTKFFRQNGKDTRGKTEHTRREGCENAVVVGKSKTLLLPFKKNNEQFKATFKSTLWV